jgi:hypothetical protein
MKPFLIEYGASTDKGGKQDNVCMHISLSKDGSRMHSWWSRNCLMMGIVHCLPYWTVTAPMHGLSLRVKGVGETGCSVCTAASRPYVPHIQGRLYH